MKPYRSVAKVERSFTKVARVPGEKAPVVKKLKVGVVKGFGPRSAENSLEGELIDPERLKLAGGAANLFTPEELKQFPEWLRDIMRTTPEYPRATRRGEDFDPRAVPIVPGSPAGQLMFDPSLSAKEDQVALAAKGKTTVPSTDTVPAMLTPREAVLNRNAAELAGRGNIEKLNQEGNALAEKGVDLATASELSGGGKNMNKKVKKMQGGGQVPGGVATQRRIPAAEAALAVPQARPGGLPTGVDPLSASALAAKQKGAMPPGFWPPGATSGYGAVEGLGAPAPAIDPYPTAQSRETPGGYGKPAGWVPGAMGAPGRTTGALGADPFAKQLGGGPAMPPMVHQPALYNPTGGVEMQPLPARWNPNPLPEESVHPAMPPVPAPFERERGGKRYGPSVYKSSSFYPRAFQYGGSDVPPAQGPIGTPPRGEQAYGPPVQLTAGDVSKITKAAQAAGLNPQQISAIGQQLLGLIQGGGSVTGAGGTTGPLDAAGGFQGGISDIGYPPFIAPGAEYHADKGGWIGQYDPDYMLPHYWRGTNNVGSSFFR